MADTTTLVAKNRVKFGGGGHMDPKLGFVRTEEATTVEPGETFEIDADTAEDLIKVGAAMSQKDYDAEQRVAKSADERIEEMRSEVSQHEANAKAKTGDSIAINSAAHLASQKREEDAIAEAQTKTKKGSKADKADKDDDKDTGKGKK